MKVFEEIVANDIDPWLGNEVYKHRLRNRTSEGKNNQRGCFNRNRCSKGCCTKYYMIKKNVPCNALKLLAKKYLMYTIV